uniref:Uncharacterized protein n=1 Tax=Anguilla anguilla TaxID=7936 RepID=A0A0E9XVW9_ANGAN
MQFTAKLFCRFPLKKNFSLLFIISVIECSASTYCCIVLEYWPKLSQYTIKYIQKP